MTDRKMSAAERAYHDLRRMAINYDIRPGERINEVALSRELGVSRTPLREALNRLETEGFLTFSPQLGFFRRKLEPREIFDLVEVRSILERAGAQLATVRATDLQLAELRGLAERIAREAKGQSVVTLVSLDEQFHERVMELSGNVEMLKRLRIVNARIRFIRWGDMERASARPIADLHREQLAAMLDRDIERSGQLAEQQAMRTMDEIVEAVKLGYARIFLRDLDEPVA